MHNAKEDKLPCPIVAFVSRDDPKVGPSCGNPQLMKGWAALSKHAQMDVHLFFGNHFYLQVTPRTRTGHNLHRCINIFSAHACEHKHVLTNLEKTFKTHTRIPSVSDVGSFYFHFGIMLIQRQTDSVACIWVIPRVGVVESSYFHCGIMVMHRHTDSIACARVQDSQVRDEVANAIAARANALADLLTYEV